ncbi:right-handed parallel beta-helix repeat-containing protein, partial [bacterium]|nr:right-handed parallel beta-helix repeat-containing protein [bacterium]
MNPTIIMLFSRLSATLALIAATAGTATAANVVQTTSGLSWLDPAAWSNNAAPGSSDTYFLTAGVGPANALGQTGFLSTHAVGGTATDGSSTNFTGRSLELGLLESLFITQNLNNVASIGGGARDLIMDRGTLVFSPASQESFPTLDVNLFRVESGTNRIELRQDVQATIDGLLIGPGTVSIREFFRSNVNDARLTFTEVDSAGFTGNISVSGDITLDFEQDISFQGTVSVGAESELEIDQTHHFRSGNLSDIVNGIIPDGVYAGASLDALGGKYINSGGALIVGNPPLPTFTVTTLIDEMADPGTGLSLREALAQAPIGTIVFDPLLDGGIIPLNPAHGPLHIQKSITIDASALATGITIDGGSNGDLIKDPEETSCFLIDDGVTFNRLSVTFRGLTIQNGVSSTSDPNADDNLINAKSGANIRNLENLTLTDCTVRDGRAVNTHGGGIYQDNGRLTMAQCTVTGNQAGGDGGGIHNFRSAFLLTLTDCSITNNTAGDSGGGIRNRGTVTSASNPNIETARSAAILTDCLVSGNRSVAGGGITHTDGPLTMVGCTVSDNTTTASSGGGILFGAESFEDAVSSINLEDCTISGNRAGGFGVGGGVQLTPGGSADSPSRFTNCTIVGNSARQGGGIFILGSAFRDNTLLVTNCTIIDNAATGADGGGIRSKDANLELFNCTIIDNAASVDGGGIRFFLASVGNNTEVAPSNLKLYNCTIIGNSAGDVSGGIRAEATTLEIFNSLLLANSAPRNANFFGNTSQGSNNILDVENGGPELATYVETTTDATGAIVAVLKDNGGLTHTVQLVEGSPALDAGSDSLLPSDLVTDQRGERRISGARVDIGAFELKRPFELIALTPDVDGSTTARFGSLEATVNDPFLYDPTNPTSPLPELSFSTSNGSGFHAQELNGGDVTLIYTLDYTASGGLLRDRFVVDLWGRQETNGIILSRDDDFDVEIFSGEDSLGKFTNLGIDSSTFHTRVDFGLLPAGITLTEIVITARKSPGEDENNFTLQEIRAVVFTEEALVVTTTADELDTPAGNDLSLREAIRDAETAGVIVFDPSLDGQIIQLANAEQLVIDKSLTIDASDLANGITIDGGSDGDEVLDLNETRCFFISDRDAGNDLDVILSNLTVQNGIAKGVEGGGNISNRENLTLLNCRITDGILLAADPVISPGDGQLRILDSFGGGIYSTGGSLEMTACDISDNRTVGSVAQGAGIALVDTSASLSGCTVSRNRTSGRGADGGGIHNEDSELAITASVISDNHTAGNNADGGGISCRRNFAFGFFAMTDCAILNNSTQGNNASGGGLFNVDGMVSMTRSTIAGNSTAGTDSNGGGILDIPSSSGSNTYVRCTVTGNSAMQAQGGGFARLGGSSTEIQFSHCTIVENIAPAGSGGGIFVFGSGANFTTLTATIVRDNSGGDLVFNFTNPFIPGVGNLVGTGNGAAEFGAQINTEPILLAPLANYGGPTETMPPLPGSPAIDALDVVESDLDQRGFGLVGAPDIGAVEFQGESITEEPILSFFFDTDADGLTNGLELALGTDPDLADFQNTARPALTFNASGDATLTFGRGTTPLPDTILIIERSTDLQTFEEIYRFNFNAATSTPGTGVTQSVSANQFIITDEDAPADRA